MRPGALVLALAACAEPPPPCTLEIWPDLDGDGFGDDLAEPTYGCGDEDGWALAPGDCDDRVSTTRPGGEEVCDGVDQDCDGVADQDLVRTWYLDRDGDGVGDEATSERSCARSVGWVEEPGDCDDLDPRVGRLPRCP